MPIEAPPRGSAPTNPSVSDRALRLFALVAVSGLALGLWLVRSRVWVPGFQFLWWNLFLAWVPWGLSVVMQRVQRPATFALVGLAWLAFFPNAPYLLTDLIHLKARAPVPLWFDVLFLSSFAWAGCLVGWDSLSRVHDGLARRWSPHSAAAIVAACVVLCGVGVFLGRFERLNSWELLTAPLDVLRTTVSSLRSPRALGFSAVFAAFVGAGYLFTRASPRSA